MPSLRGSIRRRRRGFQPTDAQRIQRALEVYELTGDAAVGAPGRARAWRRARSGGRRSRSCRGIARGCMRDRRTLRRDARRGPGRRARGAARAIRAYADAAVDALRRLSAGVGISRRPHRRGDAARQGYRRDAPAREASVHLAPCAAAYPRSIRRAPRLVDDRDRGAYPRAAKACRAPDSALLPCNN